jgi:DNA-binding transcriptional ArsR family regulator
MLRFFEVDRQKYFADGISRVFGGSDLGGYLDAAFSALSDPTRRAILARLVISEATVMELAKPFKMTQPAISQHLKVLEGAGLIVRRIEGTRRPCRLAEPGLEAVDRWLGMLREALAKNYDRLDRVLAEMKPENGEENR